MNSEHGPNECSGATDCYVADSDLRGRALRERLIDLTRDCDSSGDGWRYVMIAVLRELSGVDAVKGQGLRLCEYCRSEPDMAILRGLPEGVPKSIVSCRNCRCHGPVCETMDGAADAWNRMRFAT